VASEVCVMPLVLSRVPFSNSCLVENPKLTLAIPPGFKVMGARGSRLSEELGTIHLFQLACLSALNLRSEEVGR
jgi:hypothetical protein